MFRASLHSYLVTGAASVAFAGILTTNALAATTLGWSLAGGSISSCKNACAGTDQTRLQNSWDTAYNHNASWSGSDPNYGSFAASAAPGSGPFVLPDLKAVATGANNYNGEYSAVFAFAQGVKRYRWTGSQGIDLAVDTFVGTLNYTNSAQFGSAFAALSIVDSTVGANSNLGNQWYFNDPHIFGGNGRPFGCNLPGAIAHAQTAIMTNQGSVSVNLAPTCGPATFHLDPGDDFFVWARMSLFSAGAGALDGSQGFSVALSPNLSAATLQSLNQNLRPISSTPPPIPEPSTWALTIFGFGMVGAALRRRTAAAAKSA